MKKFVIFISFLVLFLIHPTPAYADVGCSGATINASGSTLTISITTNNATDYAGSDYDLICREGVDYPFPSSCNFVSTTNVTCTVDTTTFTNSNCDTNPGMVVFGLNHSIAGGADDNCNFNLQSTQIAAALTAAGVGSTAPGIGSTAPGAAAAASAAAAAAPLVLTPFTSSGNPCHGIETGLGIIPIEPVCLVKWILKYAILMGGGIAFLLSLFGGVTIILAGGNPEKINEGKEIISSAIAGLAIIIFSVFLLRFIGLDILQLPGFKP